MKKKLLAQISNQNGICNKIILNKKTCFQNITNNLQMDMRYFKSNI